MSTNEDLRGGGDNQSVDNAYSRLETIIRSFSKEKMCLEEQINNLHCQLDVVHTDLMERNAGLKKLTVERDNYKQIHEKDEKARYGVEAMVTSFAKKIQVLCDTINSCDTVYQDIMFRFESIEEFSHVVKRIQIDLNKAKNKDIQKLLGQIHELESSKQDLTKELSKFKQAKERIEVQLLEERRASKLKEEDFDIKDAKKANELLQLKTYNENYEAQLDTLKIEIKSRDEAIAKIALEKQQIEDQLVVQIRNNEEKETELSSKEALIKELSGFKEAKEQIEAQLLEERRVSKLKEEEFGVKDANKVSELLQLKASNENYEAQLNNLKTDIKTRDETIAQAALEKQQIEDQLLVQMKNIEEKETELSSKDNLIKELTELKEAKEQIEAQLLEERRVSKLKEEEFDVKDTDKANELLQLKTCNENYEAQLDTLKTEIKSRDEAIAQAALEKQQIEGQLLVQMRNNKEKETELQDNAKEHSKQLAVIRSGYQDLASMLDITKNEKSSLAESHSKLLQEKKEMELELNEELKIRKGKLDSLKEEAETLRIVQKRYLDLKKHLSSLMKDKTTNNQSTAESREKEVGSDKGKTNGSLQEDNTKTDSVRPPHSSIRRSQPVIPMSHRPVGILKTQDTNEKKSVSFGSTFSMGFSSTSSDSSSEPEPTNDLGPMSQKKLPMTSTKTKGTTRKRLSLDDMNDYGTPKRANIELVSTPQKRSNDFPTKEDTPEAKKKRASEPEGQKLFRKKPTPSVSPFLKQK